jgi:outer membrane lipoprotein-sorting protein
MKKLLPFFLAAVMVLTLSFTGEEPTAKEIVTKAENNIHGLSSQIVMTIQIVRPTWTRSMTVKTWTKGEDYSISIVTAPAKDAGTVFLKRLKEIWNWVPSIERVVKLPPSMMAQSWMGTDFTNDDLVKASSRIDDYTHKLLGDTVIANRKCWKIEMTPLPNAAVIWGKVNIWIDQKDYLELRLEFYDEDNKLVNVLQSSDIKTMGGRTMPSKMEMIPAEKKGQETIITYNSATFDQKIDDDFFTTQNMKKIK